jgi:AcrR family transcriptional regulator
MNHPPLPPGRPSAIGEGSEESPLLSGVRLPRQTRSQASFDRMVAAAMGLIAEEGLEGATVQAIMSRAGAGAGTFYARFDSRDALLAYLATRFWEDARDGWKAVLAPDRWSAADARAIVGQSVRMLVLWSRAHGSLLRAFLVHAMSHPEPWLLDRTAELDNQVADYLIELLMERRDEFDHADPEQAIRLATLQIVATLRSRYIFAWGLREDGIEDDHLSSELTTGFLRYLGTADADDSHGPGRELGARPGEAVLREDR